MLNDCSKKKLQDKHYKLFFIIFNARRKITLYIYVFISNLNRIFAYLQIYTKPHKIIIQNLSLVSCEFTSWIYFSNLNLVFKFRKERNTLLRVGWEKVPACKKKKERNNLKFKQLFFCSALSLQPLCRQNLSCNSEARVETQRDVRENDKRTKELVVSLATRSCLNVPR